MVPVGKSHLVFSWLVRRKIRMWKLRFPVHPWIPRNVFYLSHGVWKSVQLHCDGQCRLCPTRIGPISGKAWNNLSTLSRKPVALLVSVRDGSYVQQSPWLRDQLSSTFSVLKDPRSRQWLPRWLGCALDLWFVYNKCSSLEWASWGSFSPSVDISLRWMGSHRA